MGKEKKGKKEVSSSDEKENVGLIMKIVAFFRNENTRVAIGIAVCFLCLYLLLAFISFFFTGGEDQSFIQNSVSNDSSYIRSQIQNWAGYYGALAADFFINRTFGVSCFAMLFFFVLLGIRLILKNISFSLKKVFFVSSFLMIWSSLFFGFFFRPLYDSSFMFLGGEHGHQIGLWFDARIGWLGTILLLFSTMLLFCIFMYPSTLPVLQSAGRWLKSKFGKSADGTDAAVVAEETDGSDSADCDDEAADEYEDDDASDEEEPEVEDDDDEDEETDDAEDDEADAVREAEPQVEGNSEKAKTGEHDSFIINVPNSEEDLSGDEQVENQEEAFTINEVVEEEAFDPDNIEPYDPTKDLEFYKKPPLDLFKKYDVDRGYDEDELRRNNERIREVLSSFGVELTSISATVGPTVTLYEVTLAPGVKISKIKNLGDDIALSIAAKGIRIIAPIPGKGTIGIEVPNSKPKMVPMGEIIGSKKFQETKFELPIAMGRTITNEVYMVDLCKMPHILVAGATGQGKSVGLNAIITSLLYKKHPAELKFVMVDPKMVEFSMYAPIVKHFLAKMPDAEDAIITDVTKVVQTLNSLCIEMDARYELLKDAKVRQLVEYNEKFVNRKLNPNNGHKFLPYIVVVIDEFADLIMQVGKEVETPIARIAQKARAVGIHMILATQRPSANIITGVIRANFPARFAFKVSTGLESRVILDQGGAEQLIGRGDMLISQGNDFERVQCAFVDTPEVEGITQYISEQQGYPTAFLLPEYVGEEGGEVKNVDLAKRDPLFDEAAMLVVANQQGSTSMIQRKFSIGFNRAGRIMDQLEAAKIVGPVEGSKPRQVMIADISHLETVLQNLR